MIGRRIIFSVLFAMCVVLNTLSAQIVTPSPIGNQSLNNALSLGTAVRKMQTLYLPADFNNNTNNGLITHLYLRGLGLNGLNISISDLQIKMRHVQAQSFNGTQFFDSLQPVIAAVPLRTLQASMVSGSYLIIPLDFPFAYNRTLPLVVEISSTSASSTFTAMGSTKTSRRLFAGQVNATSGTLDNLQWSLGFDLIVPTGPNTGLLRLLQPTSNRVQTAKQAVQIEIRNLSSDTLRQLNLHWQIANQTATSSWTGTVGPAQAFTYLFPDSILGNNLRGDTLRVWSTAPNGLSDVQTANDTLSWILFTSLSSGVYSVGRPGSDFPQLQSAINLLNSAGFSGNLVFELENGIHQASILLTASLGVDSLQQIHFRSKSENADSVIVLSTTSPTVQANGASFVRFSNLTLRRSGLQSSASSGVVQITAGRQWQFERCKFEVIDNSYASDLIGQRNVFLSLVNDVVFHRCRFIGGSYALMASGNASVPMRNLRIDSSEISNTVAGIVHLSRLNNFVFNRNTVNKQSQLGSGNHQIHLHYTNGLAITNNYIDVVTNANLWYLFSANRLTPQGVNLISNNIVRMRQIEFGALLAFNAASFNEPPNSFQFEHNNVWASTEVNTHTNNWRMIAVEAFFAQSFNGCNIVNNIFEWHNLATSNFGSFYGTVHPIASVNLMQVNRNIYRLPVANRYAHDQNTNTMHGIGYYQGWDTHSHVMSFALDSLRGYRINAPLNSRWSVTSNAVTTDFTGRNRQLPNSDIGAYEEPTATRPLLLSGLLADTIGMQPRTFQVQGLTEQPGDTLEIRMYYKISSQNTWINTSATFVGNNRYQLTFDFARLGRGLVGPLTIEYYYLYRLPGQSWSSLPLGGDTSSAPSQLYQYRLSNVLGSLIKVGNQGDVPDIQSAFTALTNNTVRQSVTFLLTDSLYLIPANSIELNNYLSTDTAFAVVFRPDLGKNVVIRDPIGNKWAIRLNRIQHIQIQGRDTAGTGSLSFEIAGTTGGAILLPNQNSMTDNFVAENITFRSLTANNTATAIYAGGPNSVLGTSLRISNCRFLGFSPALYVTGVRNGMIENNVFGDSSAVYQFTSTVLNIVTAQRIQFQNNLIQNLRYPVARPSMYLINMEGTVNSLNVFNNRFINIGFDSLYQPNNATRRAAIIQFTQRYDTLRVIGNLMQGLTLPVSRTQAGNSIKEWYLVYDNRLSGTTPAHRFDFLHNTVSTSARYFGNCRGRFYGFRLNNVFEPNIQNNLFGFDLSGNPSFFRGSLFVPGHQPNFVFDSLRISHNVYLLDSAATFAFLLEADSVPLNGLANWRSRLARTGFQRENIAFQLQGALSTYLSGGLHPTPTLASYLDSTALPLTLPLNALSDLNNQIRMPADIGAIQVQSSRAVDNQPPAISNVALDTTLYACLSQTRTFSAQVSDAHSGVQAVQLSFWNGERALSVPLNLVAGNRFSGTWSATVSVDTSNARSSAQILAIDSLGNRSYSSQSRQYHNFDIKSTIQSASYRNTQNPIQATAIMRGNTPLAISEIGYLRNAPGFSTTLPSFADATQNNYIEITHYGTDTIDMSGFRLRITPFDTLTFPVPYLLPPGAVILITAGQPSANTTNHYFTHPGLIGFNMLTFNMSFELTNAQRTEVIDAVYMHSTNFNVISPIPGSWFGSPIFASNRMGGFKLMGTDLNNSSNWLPIGVNNPGNFGSFHLASTRKPGIQLQWGGILQGNGQSASRPPLPGGNYHITLQSSNSLCSATDSFLVRVSGNDSTDFIAPWISSPVYASTFNSISCNDQPRTVTLRARDTAFGSGVAEVRILLRHHLGISSYATQRISGNDMDGEYQVDLRNVRFSGQLLALAFDRAGNISDTLPLRIFQGLLYGVVASKDTTIVAGNNITLFAKASRADRSALQLTEVIYQLGGDLQLTLPPGMTLTGTPDVYEITNMGQDNISTGGLILRIYSGSVTHSIPVPSTIIPPQNQIFLVVGGTSAQTGSNVYWINPTPLAISSTSVVGVALIDTLVSQPFLTAVGINGFTFPANLNIPSSVWSGNGITGLSGTVGIFRQNANPNSSGWIMTNSTLGRRTNLGSSVIFTLPSDSIQWFSQGFLIGTADSLVVTPSQNTVFVAKVSNGFCTASDTIFVSVQGATQAFDVAMVNLNAPISNVINAAQVFPSIRLRNAGSVALASIPLEFNVNGQLLFRDTLRTILNPGDTANYSSSQAWQVPLGGMHQFCVKSTLQGDIQGNNDSICVQTFGREARQFAKLVEVLSPIAGANIRDSAQVRVRITNAGTDTLQAVSIRFADSLSLAVEQTFNLFLFPAQQQTLTFSRFYVPSDSSSNRLCVHLLGAWPDSVCQPLGGISTSLPSIKNPDVGLKIYPNPTNSKLYVQLTEKSAISYLQLYDAYGKLLQQFTPEDGQSAELDVKMLSTGLYFLRIYSPEKILVRRFVVEH